MSARSKRVRLEPDLKHMRVTLRLRPDMRDHLGQGTQFWIIGKNVSLSHLSNLKSIIMGESIGIRPQSGRPQDKYQGLAHAPVLGFDATGTAFTLHAATLGSVQPGTLLYYLGEQVGRVVDYRMTNGSGFDITVFVDVPYDRLVHDSSRFWRSAHCICPVAAMARRSSSSPFLRCLRVRSRLRRPRQRADSSP